MTNFIKILLQFGKFKIHFMKIQLRRGYPYIVREKSKQTLGIFCNKTRQYLDLNFGLVFIKVLKNMKIFYLLQYSDKQIRLDA